MAQDSGPRPEKGYQPRKVTDKRGGQIEPENASPRFSGSRRGQYPKSGFPQPEGAQPRATGSHQDNTQISRVVAPVVTRKTGDSLSTKNPLK